MSHEERGYRMPARMSSPASEKDSAGQMTPMPKVLLILKVNLLQSIDTGLQHIHFPFMVGSDLHL